MSDESAVIMMEALGMPGIGQVTKGEETTVDMAQFEEFVKEHGVLIDIDDENDFIQSGHESGIFEGKNLARARRRETADPTKLRELLESCSISEVDESSIESVSADDEIVSQMIKNKQRRRMSCDPGLLSARAAARRRASLADRRKTLGALSSVPEEGHSEYEASETSREDERPSSDMTQATNLDEMISLEEEKKETEEQSTLEINLEDRGRSSLTWTADEARLAVQELRRQLNVERDVASQAESERDELAKELELAQQETVSRIELIKNLEDQRDAALRRACVAETRATTTEQKSADILAAAVAAANAKCVIAENLVSAASGRETTLRSTISNLKSRISALEKVKITKDFAAKVRELADERDALKADLVKAKAESKAIVLSDKENIGTKVPIDPYRGLAHDLGASLSPGLHPNIIDDRQQESCRQS